MRKSFKYLFIAIMLTGIFSPVAEVKAEPYAPLGRPTGCYTKSNAIIVPRLTTKLECDNAGANYEWLTVAPPAPTVTFSASPTSITSGQTSTLTWSTTNATSCTASNGWSGTKTTSGTFSVSPTSNTTYTITCTGYLGRSASQSATITVGASTHNSNSKQICQWDNEADIGNVEKAKNKPCTSTYYNFLAPLPDPFNEGKSLTTIDTDGQNALGKYLNIIIRLAIGLAAVLAVIMIVMGGIEYMTSELISSKESGKSRMTNAVLGLLVALGAYLILFTINPDLLNTNPNIPPTIIAYDFEISGALSSSFSGPAIKVNFKTEAYPAAKAASESTRVNVALILAIFSQETGSGGNVGACRWTDTAANMYDEDKTALQTITRELNKNINDTPVSCALKDASGAFDGHGGAIGYTQFRPATWLAYRGEAGGYLGHTPNPWNVDDALMMEAVYLRAMGANSSEKEAACKYFAGPRKSCSSSAGINNYGNSVMGKKLSIEAQIAEAIKNGTITP